LKFRPELVRRVFGVLKFRKGLITAVVRDYRTKDVLMVAAQNQKAVERTLLEGRMFYWSRSRKKLWLKGEKSGNFQILQRVWLDCDGDVILYDVKQIGGACHEGFRSCFYREIKKGKIVVVGKKVFDPKKAYKN